MPNAARHAATRAYVQSLAEALHVELAPLGVDVLAAAPGPTHSGFAERADMRMGRALTPPDVARGRALRSAVAPLPRRVRVMGSVMAGMTNHQDPKRPRQA